MANKENCLCHIPTFSRLYINKVNDSYKLVESCFDYLFGVKIELWYIGKNAFPFVEMGIQIFKKRLVRYNSFSIQCIPDVKSGKNVVIDRIKANEADKFLSKLRPDDYLILLDEKGTSLRSVGFSAKLNIWLQLPKKRLIFLIGGAFGFDQSVYDRSDFKLSLSSMTFSHQLVRLIFMEQLYRGFTILKNEKYHNE